MKTSIKRTTVSLAIACLMVFANVIIARAGGPYYISENPLIWLAGSGTPTPVSTSSCYGGACKYMYQDTGNPATWRWAYTAKKMYMSGMCIAPTQEKRLPNIGCLLIKAALRIVGL